MLACLKCEEWALARSDMATVWLRWTDSCVGVGKVQERAEERLWSRSLANSKSEARCV